LIKVPVPLSSKIIELTGITDELLDDAPSFVEQLDEMKEFFKGADRWVAHNIDFDSKMMYFQLARHGHEFKFPWPLEKYCTLKVGKAMQAQNPSMGNAKLATVYKFLTGKDQQEAHRAEADVKVLTEVYFNMLLRP
jgi:DNA polymerase-3 subunit alpha (Gram-positive type)